METKKNGRRKFLIQASTGMAMMSLNFSEMAVAASPSNGKAQQLVSGIQTGYTQEPLPYAYNALEDVIDTMTMDIHYNKHAAGYIKNLNDAVKTLTIDTSQPVEALLSRIDSFPMKVRNNAGGHVNHEMFWKCLRPIRADNMPSGILLEKINRDFQSFDLFKEQFAKTAMGQFGSGWAWLCTDASDKLIIGSTSNQDNPLMNVSNFKGKPLLNLDIWEHAYYLKYQNKRAEYINNWWQVVNWSFVEQIH